MCKMRKSTDAVSSRKAKYCSKSCQSKAWADGHRWWCVERPHNSHPPPNPTATSSTTQAAAAAVVAAAPPPPPPAEQVVHLEDNVTSDVLAIPIGEHNNGQENNTTQTAQLRRSSLPVTTNENHHTTPTIASRAPRDGDLLFNYHHAQRRNSRSVRSLASGSSTEVETENNSDNNRERPRDLMDVD